MDSKKLFAELIGTFILVLIGAGAGAVSDSIVAVGLAHGLIVIAMIYSLGDISGAHINPAVSFSFAFSGKMSWGEAAGYITAQLLGGVLAGLLLLAILGAPTAVSDLGNTVLGNDVTIIQGLLVEIFLTFILIHTIFQTSFSSDAGNMSAVAIGLVLVGVIMMGMNISGASLNPARTLGPAVVSFSEFPWDQFWIYIVGPLTGGVLAALVHRVLRD